MKKFKYFLIPTFLIIIFSFIFNNYIDYQYNKLKNEKDISVLKHTYNTIVRDRGGLLKDQMREEGDLMIFGSSELSSTVNQNPINMFPNNYANYDVSIYGRAHTQSLQHSAIISSTKNLKSTDKMAIIISAQWFDFDRIKGNGTEFSVNFSELQFYDFLNNEELSDESKHYFAERVGDQLEQSGQFIEEQIYAKLYIKKDKVSKILFNVLKPYYKFKENMLIIKDKVQTIKSMKDLDNKTSNVNIRNINWEEEYYKAEQEGRSKVTNNELYVDDDYYNEYIKDNYDQVKDKWKDKDLLSTPELGDYKLLLQVCNELGVKPLIVLMPVNGIYYDHMGWTEDKRIEFYNEIEKLAKEHGFDVLNLQNKEYEKYYLSDVMHLGWKGWLNIDEEMYKYFKEKQ